jgi:hypothetical protein
MSAEPIIDGDGFEFGAHWGVISDGSFLAEYRTHQPDPSHWIAVGVVTAADPPLNARRIPRMLIGAGRSEEAAIHDLELRLFQDDFSVAA